MWHRRHEDKASQERGGQPDPISAAVWHDGHLTGPSASTPVIKAPRAGDVAAHEAA